MRERILEPLGMTITGVILEGELHARPTAQRSTRLLHQGDHTFVPALDTDIRLVFTVEDGRAIRVTLHQGGGALHGDRQP